MAYLLSDSITRIQARIVSKEASLAVLEDTLAKASERHVLSYRLGSGDGATSVENRSLHEIRNNIRILENEIDALYRKLNGSGVVNMQLRRKL